MAKHTPKDYQALNQELDDVLARLQADDLDVDEALRAYERGLAIVNDLQQYLQVAETKITKLTIAPEAS